MSKINVAARDAALKLHTLGMNVTAIPAGGKEPQHQWNEKRAPWGVKRQPLDVVESLPWNAERYVWKGCEYPAIETVGIIEGIGGARMFDIDGRIDPTDPEKKRKIPVPEHIRESVLAALGIAPGNPWHGRSKSGAGFHVRLVCHDPLPDELATAAAADAAAGGSGVKIGDPLPEFVGDYDHLELRWERCQSVLPSPTGYNGHLPDELPVEVTAEQVLAAFLSIATPRTHHGKPHAAKPVQPQPAQRVPVGATSTGGLVDVIGPFNAAHPCGQVLERNGYTPVPGGWSHPATSQPGAAGVKAEGDRVRSFSATDPLNDGQHSHDAFSCFTILEHGGDPRAARRAAAAELGIELPQARNEDAAAKTTSQHNCTDLGNARRLVERHGADLRYVHRWGRWLVWNGRCWEHDETGDVDRRARETARAIYEAAAQLDDSAERKTMARWAMATESKGRLEAMIALAQAEPGIPVLHSSLDSKPWLLNVANGTLDLHTGQLRAHEREDLLTKIVNVAYDPDAPCPTWLQFLNRIFNSDQELITFVQRAVGYSLTGDVSEQMLFFSYGAGQNGKSTFFEVLMALLGEYAQKAPTEMLMQKLHGAGVPNDVARLPGARLVVAAEVEEGRRLAESVVKDLTGGDTLSARFMRQEWFDFRPTHKLWLYGNHKPVIRGTDTGIWRRLITVPFTVTIPPEERDIRFKDRLLAELTGILAWSVRGCLDWQRHGMQIPACVRAANSDYREEMDIVGAFIADCCLTHRRYSIEATALYNAYGEWCEENGERALTQTRFGRDLALRGLPDERCSTTGRKMRLGIRLRTIDDVIDAHPEQTEQFGGENHITELFKNPHGVIAKNCSNCSVPSATDAGGDVQPKIEPETVAVSASRVQELLDQGLSPGTAQRRAVEEARDHAVVSQADRMVERALAHAAEYVREGRPERARQCAADVPDPRYASTLQQIEAMIAAAREIVAQRRE